MRFLIKAKVFLLRISSEYIIKLTGFCTETSISIFIINDKCTGYILRLTFSTLDKALISQLREQSQTYLQIQVDHTL